MSLQHKVIAITGAASGIGFATAKLLASRGATLCMADISVPSADSLDFVQVPFLFSKLDITDRRKVDEWIEEIVAKYGTLDGAVNCAGIIGKRPGLTKITELEDEECNEILSVNLTGLMYCLRAELRKIVDGGSIVNISSIQGVMGFPGSGAYSASKHGVIGLTRAAAKEVGDREIRVNAIAPGSIETPLLQKAREVNPAEGNDMPTAIKGTGTPEEIAGIISFLLGPDSTYVTGSVYGADGGWNC